MQEARGKMEKARGHREEAIGKRPQGRGHREEARGKKQKGRGKSEEDDDDGIFVFVQSIRFSPRLFPHAKTGCICFASGCCLRGFVFIISSQRCIMSHLLYHVIRKTHTKYTSAIALFPHEISIYHRPVSSQNKS